MNDKATRIADSIPNPQARVTRLCLANMTDAIIDKVLERFAVVEKRMKAMEERMGAVETRGLRYCGTWSRASNYTRGSICTHSSALWICAADETTQKPGTGEHWQLCAKGVK